MTDYIRSSTATTSNSPNSTSLSECPQSPASMSTVYVNCYWRSVKITDNNATVYTTTISTTHSMSPLYISDKLDDGPADALHWAALDTTHNQWWENSVLDCRVCPRYRTWGVGKLLLYQWESLAGFELSVLESVGAYARE
jgi:hypothetical protein